MCFKVVFPFKHKTPTQYIPQTPTFITVALTAAPYPSLP